MARCNLAAYTRRMCAPRNSPAACGAFPHVRDLCARGEDSASDRALPQLHGLLHTKKAASIAATDVHGLFREAENPDSSVLPRIRRSFRRCMYIYDRSRI